MLLADVLGPKDCWPAKHWPPLSVNKPKFDDWGRIGPGSWLAKSGTCQQLAEAAMRFGLPEGAASRQAMGVVGFGWGGYLALSCAQEEEMKPANVAAAVAWYPITMGQDAKAADRITKPVALLPAKYGPMERVMLELLDRKESLAKESVFIRTGALKPGYATTEPVTWGTKEAVLAAEELELGLGFIEAVMEGRVFEKSYARVQEEKDRKRKALLQPFKAVEAVEAKETE